MKTVRKAFVFLFLVYSLAIFSQEKKWRFYGGVGLSFGIGGGTELISFQLQPGLLYRAAKNWDVGGGLYYAYYGNNTPNGYSKSNIYGTSLLTAYQPFKNLESSMEFQYLFVKQKYAGQTYHREVPALYLGIGYRIPHAVIGFRYDLLYREGRSIYSSPFEPFIRIYF